jgi:DNA-binding GntR family transcriptional regulator
VTTADSVHESIKNGILRGEYQSGAFVREEAIAKQLEVSRTPVREAIRRLVSEGWLEAIPNRGSRVVLWTEADVEEVFELRALLEPLLARCAARHVADQQLEELELLATAMEALAARDTPSARDEIAKLNRRFHDIITEAAERPRTEKILHGVAQMPVVRRSFHHYTSTELQRSMSQHRELIRALALRDGEWAAAVMRAHILAARAVHMRGTARDGHTVDRAGSRGIEERHETA